MTAWTHRTSFPASYRLVWALLAAASFCPASAGCGGGGHASVGPRADASADSSAGTGDVGDAGEVGANVLTAHPIVIATASRTPRTTTWSVNYWQWAPTYGDQVAGTEALVSAIAPAVMRIGGYNNDANTPDAFDDAQLDRAVAYARAIGAEPLIQVPLLQDTDGSVPTPATGAAMVTYANVTRGYGVKYFSVGNEPDIYPAQGLPSDMTRPARPGYQPSDYCASARAYVAAMKAVDPSIQIVGPDLGYHYQPNEDWLTPILAGCGDLFDVVSVHRYPFSAVNATLEGAAADAPAFASTMQTVRGLMRAAGYGDKPLALMEMNVAYDATPAGSMPLAAPGTVPSALWLADALGSSFQLGLWTAAVWNISDTDDWSLGIIGPPPAHTPRPEYYAMKLYADHFGPTLVGVTAAPAGVRAYASRNAADDATEVVVVNWNVSSEPAALEVTGLPVAPAPPTYLLPPLSVSAIEIPDQGDASASTYGDSQHTRSLGPQPLAPIVGAVADDAGVAASDASDGAAKASTCASTLLSSAAITTQGRIDGAILAFGPPNDTWGSFTYAGSGQPTPAASVTPDGNGIHIVAQLVAPTAATDFDGVGLYYSSSLCVDASAYTGVAFDFSGSLGGCSLSLGVLSSEDLSTADDPTRGACPPNPSSCYGPSAQVFPGATTVHVPFSSLAAGMPVGTLDLGTIVSIEWQLSAPLDGPDGGGCSADFVVANATFY